MLDDQPASRHRRRVLRAALALPLLASLRSRAAEPGAGAFWDVAGKRYVDEATLADRLVRVRYRLLGEVHDNPSHHAIRARLVAAIGARGKRPGVAFEQLDLDHADALAAAQAGPTDAEAVATAGKLDRPSWRWPLHRPVFEAALAAGMPVRAANLSRPALQAALRAAPGADAPAWKRRLDATLWSAAQAAALAESIEDGHCGKLPPDVLPRIALAQRMRDAAMAQALVDAATADGAILIAGDGHVRRDIGVPAYLGLDAEAVSLGIVEVKPAERAAKGFPADDPERLQGFDFVAFTDPAARPDPCADIPDPPKR